MIYNVVLVSGVWQSESVMHVHISTFLKILFPFRYYCRIMGGLPWWLGGKESAYNVGDLGSIPKGRKIPLEKGMATHSSILA